MSRPQWILFLGVLAGLLLVSCGSGGGAGDDSGGSKDDDSAPVNDDDNDDDALPTDDDTMDDDSGDDTSTCEGCLILDECYDEGEQKPDDSCYLCDPQQSPTDWSLNDGASCDDGLWCNGSDFCLGGGCSQHSADPCSDDGLWCNGSEFCDEINDECTHTATPEETCPDDGSWCNGTETCDEINDECAHTATLEETCPDDGIWCNGTETCDEINDECAHTATPEETCPDDGIWCNGTETCDEETDTCAHVEAPFCPDDGLWCNGTEFCDESNDQCAHTATPETTCPSNGVFCDGTEECNETDDLCESMGNPCSSTQECNELSDACDRYCYQDLDGDGFGNPSVRELLAGASCADGWVEENTDCNDNDPLINPGVPDLPDGVDRNCDDESITMSDESGIFVAKSGNDANPGTMLLPKLTIQAGVNAAAASGKSVFVSAGTYVENVNTSVSLFGGYESGGWTRDIVAYNTAVNATGQEPGIRITAGASVAVEGFHIVGGSPNGTTCDSFGIHTEVAESTFLNRNYIHGGFPQCTSSWSYGIYSGGQTTITNNTIEGGVNNTQSSNSSHGIYMKNGRAYIAENTINGGSPPGTIPKPMTHGFYLAAGNATLIGNTISGGGGISSYGIRLNGGTAGIRGNDINGGTGYDYAYGIFVGSSCGANVTGNEISGCTSGTKARESSEGIHSLGALFLGDSTVDGGTAYGNTIGVYLESGTPTVQGNSIDGGTSIDPNSSYGMQIDCGGTVSQNEISGGTGGFESIAVGVQNGPPVLTDNDLYGGTGKYYATGLYVYGGGTFDRNHIHGGDPITETLSIGVHVAHANTVLVSNSIIMYGTANLAYAAFSQAANYPNFVNDILTKGPTAASGRVGLMVTYNGRATLVNSIIVGITDKGVWVKNGGAVKVINTIIYEPFYAIYSTKESLSYQNQFTLMNNRLTNLEYEWWDDLIYHYTYSVAQINNCQFDGCVQAGGNILGEPGFVSPTDYHLTPTSLCIDSGINPDPWYNGGADHFDYYEGNPRPTGISWEMGVDEYVP